MPSNSSRLDFSPYSEYATLSRHGIEKLQCLSLSILAIFVQLYFRTRCFGTPLSRKIEIKMQTPAYRENFNPLIALQTIFDASYNLLDCFSDLIVHSSACSDCP